MAKPFKKLRDKMSPESREKSGEIAAKLLAEADKIEIHKKATSEEGRRAFLSRPQIPIEKNPYKDTIMLVGEHRIPLGPVWEKAWKIEQELRAPSPEQEND